MTSNIHGIFDAVSSDLLLKHKDVMMRWADALESGKYKQGARFLRQDHHHFCPMGVLCDVCDPKGWAELPDCRKNAYPGYAYRSSTDTIPSDLSVLEILSTDILGNQEDSIESYIAKLNDDNAMSFRDLAQEIRRTYAEIDRSKSLNMRAVVDSTIYHLGIPLTAKPPTEDARLILEAWEKTMQWLEGELIGVSLFEQAALITCSFPTRFSIEFVVNQLKEKAKAASARHNMWRDSGYMACTQAQEPQKMLRYYLDIAHKSTT